MFKRLPDPRLDLPDNGRPVVNFSFDGRMLTARAGDSVACALLAGGIHACRTTPVSGAARGPFCLMGACFECLVSIDGKANRQACMTPVTEGMSVLSQTGAPTLAPPEYGEAP